MNTSLLTEQFTITPSPIPNEGLMFKDYSKEGKSGHLGHGLVEYNRGSILAFYPNCSGVEGGHSGRGWMEFKRSVDGGETWDDGQPFRFSVEVFENSQHRESAMVEKVVSPRADVIVAFTLQCDVFETPIWEPYHIPHVVRSMDGGKTWEEGLALGNEPGRVFDAIVHEGRIYAMLMRDRETKDFSHFSAAQRFSVMVSEDEGRGFAEWGVIPFATGRGYGAMEVLKDGNLIAYTYTREDEQHLEYSISHDAGRTWSAVNKTYLAKKMRNPQLVRFNDTYFMHGRSGKEIGQGHLVLYTSADGIHWDEGRYLTMQTHGAGAYSNNLVVGKGESPDRQRLLVMSSHAYDQDKTNIIYWWIELKKKGEPK
jgi:hypothetical protein